MDELLKKLLESEVLNEETTKELQEAFQGKIDEAIAAAKKETAADVRAELTEQWVAERDQLVEAVDSKVTEFLTDELAELKEDLESFRDLEAEYAEKVVEAKAAMSDELQSDLGELVEKIDAFLEIRIGSEMDELREDLEEVRKNDFGRTIFEAFAQEYMDSYSDDESAEASLRETEARLTDTEAALEESEAARSELERIAKMDEILAPLSGRQKEVMEAILNNVPTERLDEGFETFIGRVIRETDETSEKESKVLAESDSEDDDDDDDDDKKGKKCKKCGKSPCKCKKKGDDDDKDDISEGFFVTGDNETLVEDGSGKTVDPQIARLRKLAGIK